MKESLNEQGDVLNVYLSFVLDTKPGFPGLNPPIPWEHAPRPHFPLVPASWPYGLHQNFMHQKCQIPAQQTFLYSRYHCLHICYKAEWVLFWYCGAFVKGQDLGVKRKLYEFSKHSLREHTVCQTLLDAYCSSRSQIVTPTLIHILLGKLSM